MLFTFRTILMHCYTFCSVCYIFRICTHKTDFIFTNTFTTRLRFGSCNSNNPITSLVRIITYFNRKHIIYNAQSFSICIF